MKTKVPIESKEHKTMGKDAVSIKKYGNDVSKTLKRLLDKAKVAQEKRK